MKNILVVEDSTTVTKILKHLIGTHPDLNALYAGSMAEGKAAQQKFGDQFFVALVDLNLPDAPRGEMVDYFLQQNIPVVVLTANYSDEKREELFNKGIVDYIIKESRYSYNFALHLVDRLYKNQHIKILVAEDDSSTRAFIKSLLEIHLYQVLDAADGLEALDVLANNPDVKLLITDYHMPEMDGFQLVRSLRQNVDKSDLVIIGLSGQTGGSLSAQFIKNGANDFLKKPFSQEEFYCRITHNLEELELIQKIRDAANHDFLTGLKNRRYFYELGEKLHQQACTSNTPLAVALLDIDHFKHINDEYGHKAGDSVLVTMAEGLQQAFSRFLVARFGGEEFVIIFAGLNNQQAFSLLDGFRSVMNTLNFVTGGEDPEYLNVTFSGGVTNFIGETLDEQINSADQLLYRAKEAGRNMVLGDDEEEQLDEG